MLRFVGFRFYRDIGGVFWKTDYTLFGGIQELARLFIEDRAFYKRFGGRMCLWGWMSGRIDFARGFYNFMYKFRYNIKGNRKFPFLSLKKTGSMVFV